MHKLTWAEASDSSMIPGFRNIPQSKKDTGTSEFGKFAFFLWLLFDPIWNITKAVLNKAG